MFVTPQHGVEDVYSATMADLSTITGAKQLYLADLVQFVSIEVDEKSASYNYLTGIHKKYIYII